MTYALSALAFITACGTAAGLALWLRRPAVREGRGHHTAHALAAAAEKAADDAHVSVLRRARSRMPVWPATRARVTVASFRAAVAAAADCGRGLDWTAPSPRPQWPGGLSGDVPSLPVPLPGEPGMSVRHRDGCIPVLRPLEARPPWESAIQPGAAGRHA